MGSTPLLFFNISGKFRDRQGEQESKDNAIIHRNTESQHRTKYGKIFQDRSWSFFEDRT